MSAPTDRLHDPNSVAFYAPKGQRSLRLGEVADAAAALVPARQADNSNTPEAPFEGDVAIRRLRARLSLDPELPPAPPPAVHNRSWMGVLGRLVLVFIASAIAALFVIGQLPIPDAQQAKPVELASTRPGEAVATKRADVIPPQLVVQAMQGNKGEPAPL